MKTERLYGRELREEDIEWFYDLQSNPAVMKFVGRPPMDYEESLLDLQKLIGHYAANDGFRVWGFFAMTDDEMIGTGALVSNEKGNEIGFRVREKFWGNGYGLEITNAVLKYGFTALGMKEIFAEVDQRNLPSIKVLDKTLKRKTPFWSEEFQSNDFRYDIKHNEYEKV